MTNRVNFLAQLKVTVAEKTSAKGFIEGRDQVSNSRVQDGIKQHQSKVQGLNSSLTFSLYEVM